MIVVIASDDIRYVFTLNIGIPRPEDIKRFSCLTHLSFYLTFYLDINIKISTKLFS